MTLELQCHTISKCVCQYYLKQGENMDLLDFTIKIDSVLYVSIPYFFCPYFHKMLPEGSVYYF